MSGTDDLARTLAEVVRIMEPAQHPWWVISGAACALYGIELSAVTDVDVLFDRRDADAVLTGHGIAATAGRATRRFHSQILAQWKHAPLAIELFAEFRVREDGLWQRIQLETRTFRSIAGLTIPLPSATELADLLERFGRPKDLRRAKLLRAAAQSHLG